MTQARCYALIIVGNIRNDIYYLARYINGIVTYALLVYHFNFKGFYRSIESYGFRIWMNSQFDEKIITFVYGCFCFGLALHSERVSFKDHLKTIFMFNFFIYL